MSVEWELKFQALAPPFKIFGLRFRAPTPQPWLEPTVFGNEYKCFGSLFLQMQCIRFAVRFLC